MGKKLSDRNHKVQVEKVRGGSTPEQRMAATNARRQAQRTARKAILRAEAEARLAAWQELTPQERVKQLDLRLGKGRGAHRQRTKLAQMIEDLEKAKKEREEKKKEGKK